MKITTRILVGLALLPFAYITYVEFSIVSLNKKSLTESENGNYSKAISIINEAISLKQEPFLYVNRGAHHEKKGELDKAIEDCSQAIALDPGYADAYYGRGTIYSRKGDLDKAIEDFNKTIALNPDYVDAYYNRGNQHSKNSAFDKGIADYTKAISLKPDHLRAYFNRGNRYINKGEFEKAIADYTTAIAIAPNFAEAYKNRSICYTQLKKPKLAQEDLDAYGQLTEPGSQ